MVIRIATIGEGLRPCEALVRVAGMDLTRLLPAVVSFSERSFGKEQSA